MTQHDAKNLRSQPCSDMDACHGAASATLPTTLWWAIPPACAASGPGVRFRLPAWRTHTRAGDLPVGRRPVEHLSTLSPVT